MLINWLIVTGYAALVWGGTYIILRIVLGPIEKNLYHINRRLMALGKGDGGKAPNTGSNTSQQRDNKATATGKPVDPNRPHMDKDK